jgi:hypothetical protein
MDASGRALGRKYLRQRAFDETWSTLSLPIKQPPPKTLNFGEWLSLKFEYWEGVYIWEIM